MSPSSKKKRAPRNRTLFVEEEERSTLENQVHIFEETLPASNPENLIINGDCFEILRQLPESSVNLLIADPPYNLSKSFGQSTFKQRSSDAYQEWLDSWLKLAVPLLTPDATVYICGDWRSGSAIQRVGTKYFKLRNRITWEREKGRGAKSNWKNSSEDIWFFTVSDDFVFNASDVRLKRKVIAPYTENGKPKDWQREKDGDFRMTAPSNLWTDLSVPFWSMPENTDHPTQKPEKLAAKLILASSNAGDMILDPFSGSGTFAVTSKKLDRKFLAIESDLDYCLVAQKRLLLAEEDKSIQGFKDGVFWERNSR